MSRSFGPHAPLLLLLVLLVAAVPPPAAASASVEDRTFVVRAVNRADDRVVITLGSTNFPTMLITLSLLSNGALVATPEISRSSWIVGDTYNLTFTLVKPVDQATLRIHYSRGGGVFQEENIALLVPDRAAPTPRQLTVVDASAFGNHTLNLTLLNSGARAVGRVLASVEDRAGVKIATPYEREISFLAPGERVNVSFDVTRPTPDVTVVLRYGAFEEDTKLHVRGINATGGAGTKTGNLSVVTDYPFRDTEPGKTVTYPLSVRNEGGDRLVELAVEGLPAGYSYRFYVSSNGVPSLSIPAGQTREVRLEITVPATAGDLVGSSIGFQAVFTSRGAELARLDLSLTLRGQGRLELEGENWFASIGPGETRELNVTVRNTGTAPLYEVRVESSKPSGWQVIPDPPRIPKLDPGAAVVVTLKVRAPDDVGTGKYIIDVKAQNHETAARVRTVSVDVSSPESSNIGWIIAAAFAGLVAVVIVVKIKRK